jgi:hypothetical protein
MVASGMEPTQPQTPQPQSPSRTLNDLFLPLTNTLASALVAQAPESPEDPRLQGLISSQVLNIQLSTADTLHALAMRQPDNFAVTNKLIRLLSLLDRTQTRVQRNMKPEVKEDQELTIQRQEAHTFLQEELSKGPRPANELFTAASKLGIARRTLIRAKADLAIHSMLNHSATMRCWMWSMSSFNQPQNPQETGLKMKTAQNTPKSM